jgi:RecA-family ATPase
MLGISLLQRLCDECDATVMVLWHPSQAGQERGDASGWSVAWHNRPRGRLSLKRGDETGEAFDLKVEKHNHGPSGKTIRLYWCDGVLLPRTEIEEVDQEARLLNACVALAVEAAAKNTPFHKMTKTAAWMLNAIHDRCGQRPTATAFKNKLEQAVFLEMLRYQRAHGKTKAGYFPVNEIDN